MVRRRPDLHYTSPTLAAVYDDTRGWSADRGLYLALADRPALRILDLGCGTGLLCRAFAGRGHDVTGVDPAAAMLDVARSGPFGSRVEWIELDAGDYRSERRFDLVVMTGHAFQTLLDEREVAALFRGVREHLAESGTFAFESRNPAVDWAAECDGWSTRVETAFGPMTWSITVLDATRASIAFRQDFAFEHETLSSTSRLAFREREALRQGIERAGLALVERFGERDRTPFDPETSPEMIFVCAPVSIPVRGSQRRSVPVLARSP